MVCYLSLYFCLFQFTKVWNSKYFKWEKIGKGVLKMWFVNLFGIFWDISINIESLLEHFEDYKRIVFMERNY